MQNNNLNNNEILQTTSSNQSEQALKDNSNTWVSFLTENVSISRADNKPLYNPEAPNQNNQKALEQALKVIEELGGGITKKEPKENHEYRFSSYGEITFNFVETKVEPKSEQIIKAEEIEQPEEKTELKSIDVAKEVKDVLIASTKKAIGTIFGIFKDLFGGLISVYKQSTERVLTEEEKRKKEEEKQKAAKRGANKKAFFQSLSEEISKIKSEFLQWVAQNKRRLKIEGLSLDESNKLMGKTRNVSFRDIDNVYDHENIAVEKQAMEAKRREEERQKAVRLAIGKKKTQRGPNVDMNMEKAGSSDNQVTKLVG